MAFKICTKCKAAGLPRSEWVIPAGTAYNAHREGHRRAGRPQHWSAEGKHNRGVALKRDGHRCRSCKRSREQLAFVGLTLEVHHLKPGDDRLELLVTLCSDCHAAIPKRQSRPLGGIPGSD